MDVYSSEHTVSPMTDTGETSDGEKETDIDPLYTGARMELKVQSTEAKDPAAQSQRQTNEINVESSVPPLAQHDPMSTGEVVNESSNNLPIHNYPSHSHSHNLSLSVQENGHPHGHEILSSKSSSVYDFNDSTSVSEESHSEMPLVNVPMNDRGLSISHKECDQIQSESLENNQEKTPLSHSVSEFSGHNHTQSHSQSGPLPHLNQSHQNFAQTHDLSQSHSVPQSLQGINQQAGHNPTHLQNQRLGTPVSGQAGDQSLPLEIGGQSFNANDSYDDSLSVVSDYSNPSNCYDGIIRRARGRPRGSKNGTGMGRARGRGYKYTRVSEERATPTNTPQSFDLRTVTDPYSCQRRGRPRSRFIVDLGEQNHEAWTKSKEELKITDAELTTLLLSL